MTHTPGPWEAIGNAVHAANGREIIFGQHNTRSADDAEKRANARLIAQAPAMLATLRLIAPRAHDPVCSARISAACDCGISDARAILRAVEG
jgi:hypothetical protein